MAKETYGYTAPQYFYWETLKGGGKYIKNGSWNFEMKKYTNYIDGEPRKVWDHPRIYNSRGYWKYNFVENGKYAEIGDYMLDDYYYLYEIIVDPVTGHYYHPHNDEAEPYHGIFPTVSGDGAKLTGTSKADSISNNGSKVTILAGAGKDTINNSGSKANIDAGTGDDSIHNYSKNVTIAAGAGNDEIYNDGDKVTIAAGAGNDDIGNGGDKVTIDAGTGKDTISNWGSNVSINATADGKADSISNNGSKVTILGGKDKDTIKNSGSNVTIDGGDGNNSISNDGSKVTISSGKDKDTIVNHGSNVSINGGDGENLISLTGGKDISIKGGKDTETFIIEAYNHLTASIQSGEGKNVIKFLGDWGYGGNFLSVSGGVNEIPSIQTTNNTLITGAGDDSVTIGSNYNSIIAGTYDISAGGLDEDYILANSGENNTIDTGYGKDIVWLKDAAKNNTIDTGAQGDSIRSEGAYNSINAGAGDDTVENWGGQVTIQSGDPDITAGKNLIKNHVDDVTIQGGGQADTIENYTGRNVSINGGRGNDIIKLYSTESVENLLTAALTPLLNGVKDFNLKKINNIIDIYNTVAKVIDGFEQISQLESSYKGKNQIKIRDRLKKISDEAGELDEALEKSEELLESAGYSTDEISALRKSTGKIQKVAGKGIKFFDNTEIVTGMMKEYADNKIWSTFAKELASDFEKIDGRLSFVAKKPVGTPTTVHGGKGNDKIYSDERKFHVYEYTAGDGSDTIFSWNLNDTLSISGGSYTGEIVNGDYVVTVGKGSVTFKNYTSRSIQQVLVGDSFEKLPCQIEGQMLSGGSRNDWHEASGSYWQTVEPPPEGISVDCNELTVAKNFSGEINLSKDYATYITKVDASNAAGNVEIIGSDSTERITAGKGNDNVHSNRSFTVIHSGAGKDIVSSSGDNNSINSGADNDIIVNLGDCVTVDSGAGNDSIISDGKENLFIVADGGNKIIYGFGKTDTLQIVDDSGTYSKKKKGDNLIITADDGKITLAGAASLKSAHIEVSVTSGRDIYNDESNAVLLGTNKADTIYNNGAGVSISALGGDDSIRNYGDNVTISGGKGNDSVESWRVGTAYVYSAGNDTLDGFNEDDTIVLGSVKVNSSVSADGTVTLNLSNKKTLTLQNYWSDKINTVKAVEDVKAINIVRNYDSSVSVEGSSVADYIENSGDNVTVSALGGNDTVKNWNANVSIHGGAGDDEIFNNGGDHVTINGGKGNDFVYSQGVGMAYVYSAGNDAIDGFNDTSTLQITSGTIDKATSDGENLFLTVGKGTIFLMGAAWLESWNVVNAKGNPISFNVDDGKAKNIYNDKSNIKISGSDNNDTVDNFGNKVTVTSGAGNDSLRNHGTHVFIEAGADDDTIEAYMIDKDSSSYTTLRGGAGNDHIDNHGHHALIEGGTGNDTLGNYTGDDNGIHEQYEADYSTMLGGDGDDFIDNHGDNSSIDGGAGNDHIDNHADNVTISAAGGNDYIVNEWSNNVSISAGAGNDTINSSGNNITVSGGKGNDYFNHSGLERTAYVYTGGNDTISGFSWLQPLVIADSKWTSQWAEDSTIIVNVEGKGTITLPNYWAWLGNINIVSSLNEVKHYNVDIANKGGTLTGTSGDDYIWNGDESATIKGLAGDDFIINTADRVSINAGNNNNIIYNGGGGENGWVSGFYTTITSGSGNDSVVNYLSNVSISTGSGDDVVETWADKVTIDAGKGDDFIWNNGAKVTINSGDGNDYIETSKDNVSVFGGKGDDTVVVINNESDNVTVNTGDGNDSINFWYAGESKGKKASIDAGAGDDYIRNRVDNATIDAGAGNDSIENLGNDSTILGGAGNDHISNQGDGSSINAGAGDDTVHNNSSSEVSINAGDDNDTVYNWGVSDNVTIVGGKGNDYVYAGSGVGTAYVYSTGNDTIDDFGTFDTIVLGSVKVNSSVRADGNVTLKLSNKKTLTLQNYRADNVNIATSIKDVKKVNVIRDDETNTVVKGTSKDDYIQNYGWSYNFTIAAGKGNDYIDNQAAQVSINGGAGNDSINNGGDNVTIAGSAGNDSIINRGFDNTITGGAGNDHISLEVVGNLIKYASGDGKDTIFGFNESDTLTVSGGSYSTQASGSDVLVKVGKGSILLKDAKGKALNINDTKTTDIITLSDGAEVLRNYFDGVKIQALGGNDTVDNSASSVTIDGDKGNDNIYNEYADNVSISGGAGNDFLQNWARTEWNSDTDTFETLETGDNVTLNGGTGNDYIWNEAGVNVVFQYKTGDGDDTIEGFNETSALAVTGAKYSTKKNGDNVIVTVDKGKITLQGAANLETVNIDFSKLLTVTDKTSSPMTVAADVKVINASTRTKAVKITGNKLDNEIYGGSKNDSIRGGTGADKIYGGSGNDTLWGDAGNDSLWGDAGKDTFIYTANEGTDRIFDYATGDLLKILNADGSDGYFKSSKYSGGDLTLTINGGGKIIFEDVVSSTKFNINGSSYNISGSKLVKK